MSEALLGPQQLTSSDQEGGHAMAQAVQGGSGDLGSLGEFGEPVAEGSRGEPDVVAVFRGEQPRAEGDTFGKPARPRPGARSPQLDGPPPEG